MATPLAIQPDANTDANTNTTAGVVLTALRDAQSTADALREEVKALRKERNDAQAQLEGLRAHCSWLQGQNETLAGHQAQFLEYQLQAEVNLREQAEAAQTQRIHDAAEIERLTTESRSLLQQRDTACLDQQIIRAALEASQSDAADTEKTLSATVKELEIVSAKYAKLQRRSTALPWPDLRTISPSFATRDHRKEGSHDAPSSSNLPTSYVVPTLSNMLRRRSFAHLDWLPKIVDDQSSASSAVPSSASDHSLHHTIDVRVDSISSSFGSATLAGRVRDVRKRPVVPSFCKGIVSGAFEPLGDNHIPSQAAAFTGVAAVV
ncbi:hypothetical protein HMN09_00474100 [Mycena chlorophos]|uniref:Uncharacterized protein n=1 Tax=Mycena chlorophos TaxID=658473 RepID=A0A8H6TGR3_MYCCL|nr:hypothetical protein HMN09_00474100 [Mycena chlorophos]